MGPNKPQIETNGVVVRQPIMGGRYFLADFDVELHPGADGKLEKANFKGKSNEGYDNVKEKFISIWIDNASTGPTIFEGSYDPASRTFTHTGEIEPRPGQKTKVREVIKVIDSIIRTLNGTKSMAATRSKRSRSPTPARLPRRTSDL